MRIALSIATLLFALPALAFADQASDVLKIFGHDPGIAAANACFIWRATKEELASHPKRNVVDMLVYANKSEGDDPLYGLTAQLHFKQLKKAFEIYTSCLPGTDGKTSATCWADCDGGSIKVAAKGDQSLILAIPGYVRVSDPENPDPTVDLPAGADHLHDERFEVERTALKDCLPLIYDEAIKAKVSQGLVTQ